MTKEQEHLYNCRAMKALASLTPNGSEFVDDPERCVAFVRDRFESQHRMILKLMAKIKELEQV